MTIATTLLGRHVILDGPHPVRATVVAVTFQDRIGTCAGEFLLLVEDDKGELFEVPAAASRCRLVGEVTNG